VAEKLIPDAEVDRLLRAGLDQGEVVEYLATHHNIHVSRKAISLWSRRRGLPRQRPATPYEIIPWKIEPNHRFKQVAHMLRAAAREDRGDAVPPRIAGTYAKWRQMLKDMDYVVDYDPETEGGFLYRKRKPSDGDLLVRMPSKVTAANRWEDGPYPK
jgi:hypothetical protein